MPSYDAVHYKPPAPIAEVTLLSSQTNNRVAGVILQIDTGSDITLIPRFAFDQLGISPDEQIEIASFDGTRSIAQAATLDLLFLNRIYRGRCVLCDSTHGVLGRDILNHLKLVLDGPKQEWSQAAPSA